MKKNSDFLYDAIIHLEQITKTIIEVESNRKEYDAILTIKGDQYIVIAKSEVKTSNKGIVLTQVEELGTNSKKPIIIVAKYIANNIATEFREKEINYLDVAGNSFIKHKDVLISITGQKIERISKTNQSRAFQEAGIKLIFNLLKNPHAVQASYRELAEITNISIGSVSNVMKELEELNFLLKTNNRRVLKNTKELLDRWVMAYHDVLKPRILKKRMKFSNEDNYKEWSKLSLNNNDNINLWGGESGAALLTGQLKPKEFSIYTNGSWQDIAKELKLIPGEDADIQIYYMFWKGEENPDKPIVPALLVYADLITSGYDRNTQIAQNILNNELQYIK